MPCGQLPFAARPDIESTTSFIHGKCFLNLVGETLLETYSLLGGISCSPMRAPSMFLRSSKANVVFPAPGCPRISKAFPVDSRNLSRRSRILAVFACSAFVRACATSATSNSRLGKTSSTS